MKKRHTVLHHLTNSNTPAVGKEQKKLYYTNFTINEKSCAPNRGHGDSVKVRLSEHVWTHYDTEHTLLAAWLWFALTSPPSYLLCGWTTADKMPYFRGANKTVLCRNFKQSMGARNRVGIGLSYRPARRHKLAESIPWNLVLGSRLYSGLDSWEQPDEHPLKPRWRIRAHPGPICFLRGPTWAFGDYSTSKQVDRKDRSSLVASGDRVNINVADPPTFLSDPVRGTVILTYGSKSGSRKQINLGSGQIRFLPGLFCAQWKKNCCQIGLISLKRIKYLTYFRKCLHLFDK